MLMACNEIWHDHMEAPKFKCRKNLEGFVPVTTLGDTLEESQFIFLALTLRTRYILMEIFSHPIDQPTFSS